ncbi:hypothetical protein PCANC_10099 [Puccinia coronata f. sp. avenae]|uniref:Uncharacterized protein n=1 Tax=Puccinia coronata f. sp. avenae TaxID=200324 RepID=A0A2N5SLT7_9BASI|nr:hypothetical protein PCANC_17846 [Puccinia coronata f. sp. avenae]PLW44621.1 hypothetical protein PCASD_05163 [Puccinia coronata f. sp. avenae]PLW45853.1 hypothetical protein PCANC_10099 [Puccinia coronata f. sp. avenae]
MPCRGWTSTTPFSRRDSVHPAAGVPRHSLTTGQADGNGPTLGPHSALTLTARGASAAKPTRAHNVGLA